MAIKDVQRFRKTYSFFRQIPKLVTEGGVTSMTIDKIGKVGAIDMTGISTYALTETDLESAWIIFYGTPSSSQITASFASDPATSEAWLFLSAITDPTGSFVITSPNNPSGGEIQNKGICLFTYLEGLSNTLIQPLDSQDAISFNAIPLYTGIAPVDGDAYVYSADTNVWSPSNKGMSNTSWVMKPEATSGWLFPGATQITASATEIKVATTRKQEVRTFELFANLTGSADITASLYKATNTGTPTSLAKTIILSSGQSHVTSDVGVTIDAGGVYSISFEVTGNTSSLPSNIAVVLSG